MEWTVVTVLIAIAGLFVTVGKPVIDLNKNIVTLTYETKGLKSELAEQKVALAKQQDSAHESHRRLWEHNNEQDKTIADHESRIVNLETDHRIYHKEVHT